MSEIRDSVLLDSYSYLWDGSATGWVLVSADDHFSIFNEKTRVLLAIDDDSLHQDIVSKMRQRSVKVLDSIPVGEFDPSSLVLD